MKQAFYYDTNAFWRFFIEGYVNKNQLPSELTVYSPLNTNTKITRVVSPWTIEEFFHAFIRTKDKEMKVYKQFQLPKKFFEKEILKRTDALTKIKSFLYLFSQDTVDTRVVNEIFLSLILNARENNILSVKKFEGKIHSKDLLHLSYALFFKCHTFITCDASFELLKTVNVIKRLITQYKLSQIVIIDEKLTKIIKRVVFPG